MDIPDYKPNTDKYRNSTSPQQRPKNNEVDEKKEKVVKGKVATKKPSVGKKIGGALIVEDLTKIKDYLIWDIGLPALKKTLSESVSSAVDMALFGETRRHDRRDDSRSGRRAYENMYYDRGQSSRPRVATRNGSYDFEEVLFETRSDAERVLDAMWHDVSKYGAVSVAAMYDFAGVDSEKFTDNKYGWTNLGNASVGRYSDGMHFLKLPQAELID